MPAQNEDMIRHQVELHLRELKDGTIAGHDSYGCQVCWCHWLCNEIDLLKGKPQHI